MGNAKVKKDLEKIANTPAAQLTAEQKALVRKYAKMYGVEFNPKPGCSSCYHDAVMAVYRIITREDAKKEADKDTRRYILRPGVDVWFGSIRVNEATITDELAEQILARGFETKFFVKCG